MHGAMDPTFMHYSNAHGYASSKPRGTKKSAGLKVGQHNKQIASATRAQRTTKPIGQNSVHNSTMVTTGAQSRKNRNLYTSLGNY